MSPCAWPPAECAIIAKKYGEKDFVFYLYHQEAKETETSSNSHILAIGEPNEETPGYVLAAKNRALDVIEGTIERGLDLAISAASGIGAYALLEAISNYQSTTPMSLLNSIQELRGKGRLLFKTSLCRAQDALASTLEYLKQIIGLQKRGNWHMRWWPDASSILDTIQTLAGQCVAYTKELAERIVGLFGRLIERLTEALQKLVEKFNRGLDWISRVLSNCVTYCSDGLASSGLQEKANHVLFYLASLMQFAPRASRIFTDQVETLQRTQCRDLFYNSASLVTDLQEDGHEDELLALHQKHTWFSNFLSFAGIVVARVAQFAGILALAVKLFTMVAAAPITALPVVGMLLFALLSRHLSEQVVKSLRRLIADRYFASRSKIPATARHLHPQVYSSISSQAEMLGAGAQFDNTLALFKRIMKWRQESETYGRPDDVKRMEGLLADYENFLSYHVGPATEAQLPKKQGRARKLLESLLKNIGPRLWRATGYLAQLHHTTSRQETEALVRAFMADEQVNALVQHLTGKPMHQVIETGVLLHVRIEREVLWGLLDMTLAVADGLAADAIDTLELESVGADANHGNQTAIGNHFSNSGTRDALYWMHRMRRVGGILEKTKASEERRNLRALQKFKEREADFDTFNTAMNLINTMLTTEPSDQITTRLRVLGITTDPSSRREVRRELTRMLEEAEDTIDLAKRQDLVEPLFSRQEAEESLRYWMTWRQRFLVGASMLFVGISIASFVIMPATVSRSIYTKKIESISVVGAPDWAAQSVFNWLWPSSAGVSSVFSMFSENPQISLFGRTTDAPDLTVANQETWKANLSNFLAWATNITRTVKTELNPPNGGDLPDVATLRNYFYDITDSGRSTLASLSIPEVPTTLTLSGRVPITESMEYIIKTAKEVFATSTSTKEELATSLRTLMDEQEKIFDTLRAADVMEQAKQLFFSSATERESSTINRAGWTAVSWILGVDLTNESAVDNALRELFGSIGMFWTTTGYGPVFLATFVSSFFVISVLANWKKSISAGFLWQSALDTALVTISVAGLGSILKLFVNSNWFFRFGMVTAGGLGFLFVHFTGILKILVRRLVPAGDSVVDIFEDVSGLLQKGAGQRDVSNVKLLNSMQALSTQWQNRPPIIYERWKKQVRLLGEPPRIEDVSEQEDEDEEEEEEDVDSV